MYRWQINKLANIGVFLALIGLLGCSAAKETAGDGAQAVIDQNWDAAVFYYLQAVTEDPQNVEYRMQLGRARQKASQSHFKKGMTLREMGRLHSARDELQMAVQLDPVNQFAEQVLIEVQQEIEVINGPGGAKALEEMKKRASEAKIKPPILDPTSDEPITLRFPQPKPVKEIYSALGKAYGFNVLFDPKLRNDSLSIELNDVKAERALEIVLQASGHFYKVLDEHSIIIAEDTPQNRREYEDLVIKTFFLSNADVKEIDKLLRALIEARRLATNEQLNAITLRDTADKVAIAERLIQVNDKAKAEVLVDVELLLMATNDESDLGMTLSSYSFTLGVDTESINPGGPEGALPLNMLNGISASNTFINIPSLVINLAKSTGRAEVLAQPQLRITEGEKANLHIGDRYPIPVTSFNTSRTVGSNVVPITSFQYQDIGIKIEVEPRVHHNREVTLILSVEVSNLGETVVVGPGQEAVVIGTRNITSVNRLKNGETSLLAGLFRTDMTEGKTYTPGLSSIPVIGRLFTNESRTRKRTDLVLTITPNIVRFPDISEEDLVPLWVGTESRISYYGSNRPRVASGSGSAGPFDSGQPGGTQSLKRSGERPQPKDPKDLPYHIPSSGGRAEPGDVETPPEDEGIDLVPNSGKVLGDSGGEDGSGPQASKPLLIEDDSQVSEEGVELGSAIGDLNSGSTAGDLESESQSPILVGLQPSVVSLEADEKRVLEIVATGDHTGYRLPIDLSFDPNHVEVEAIDAAAAIAVLDYGVDNEQGLVHLDLAMPLVGPIPDVVATLAVRALKAGTTPILFSSPGAVGSDASRIPVSAVDGVLYIAGDDVKWKRD